MARCCDPPPPWLGYTPPPPSLSVSFISRLKFHQVFSKQVVGQRQALLWVGAGVPDLFQLLHCALQSYPDAQRPPVAAYHTINLTRSRSGSFTLCFTRAALTSGASTARRGWWWRWR